MTMVEDLDIELNQARLAVSDWHVCKTQDELWRWRQAQQRLIDAAVAIGKAEAARGKRRRYLERRAARRAELT